MPITTIWGGVDIANQYRAAFTTLRPQNLRYWKPLFYWLLDIALVNSYLLSRAYNGSIGASRDHRDHQKFQEALAQALMTYCSVRPRSIAKYIGLLGLTAPIAENTS